MRDCSIHGDHNKQWSCLPCLHTFSGLAALEMYLHPLIGVAVLFVPGIIIMNYRRIICCRYAVWRWVCVCGGGDVCSLFLWMEYMAVSAFCSSHFLLESAKFHPSFGKWRGRSFGKKLCMVLINSFIEHCKCKLKESPVQALGNRGHL